MLIYLCSPYRGDIKNNVELAKKFMRYVLAKGQVPIAPHLLFPQILNDGIEAERALAMQMNKELMRYVDEVWVLTGKLSEGMAKELVEANRLEKPVRFISRKEVGLSRKNKLKGVNNGR